MVAVSTALSARNGLLIRNRAAFERGRNIQAIIFGKTGSLTQGAFGITDTVSLSDDMNEEKLLRYTAGFEAHSEHPIAQGIAASSHETSHLQDFT